MRVVFSRGLDFDLIVLDVMMPGEDGLSLTRDLRQTLTTPILLLTAKGEADDRITGFEAGADDYSDQTLRAQGAAFARQRDPAPDAKAAGGVAGRAGPASGAPFATTLERSELWHGQSIVRLTRDRGVADADLFGPAQPALHARANSWACLNRDKGAGQRSRGRNAPSTCRSRGCARRSK